MKRWVIAVLIFVCWSEAAAAIACRSSPGSDAYYQYRLIDGRKCWFRGHTKLEKSALAWKSENRRHSQTTVSLATAAGETLALSSAVKGQAALESPKVAATSLTSGSGEPAPDFDSTFAHWPQYAVARPVIHLIYPTRVPQSWGSKPVRTVSYRREP